MTKAPSYQHQPGSRETLVTLESEHAATLIKGGVQGFVKKLFKDNKAQWYFILNPNYKREDFGLSTSSYNDTNPVMTPLDLI